MRKSKMDIIPEGIVIVDRLGREWTRGPDYQDQITSNPGWLELQCAGVKMAFSDVVSLYGFLNDKGERFLVVTGGYPGQAV